MGENPKLKIKRERKKRKKNTDAPINPKMMKIDQEDRDERNILHIENQNTEQQLELKEPLVEDIAVRFPVLNNEELVKKFLAVPLTNNQKGRIRQVLRDNLKGTADHLLPDVIHSHIQGMLKSEENMTDSDLRKIRILYNMLKTAVSNEKISIEKKLAEKKSKVKSKKKLKKDGDQETVLSKVTVKTVKEKTDDSEKDVQNDSKDKMGKKVKGKKRYVVFVGNLPLDVTKDVIMNHFSMMRDNIVDVRLPKQKEGKKSAIAYVELKNEPTYELALSKHHSMLGSKRINVLYTTQKNGKITKAEAKSKSAKLQALQKSGKLIGSTAVNRKRSHRRLKMKKAQAQRENELAL
ncbi:hypothetical protein ACJJTC_010978 [Scirpophaga incertulas]